MSVANPDVDNVVKSPVERVVPPIGVPLIVPPVITAFDVFNDVLAVKFVNVPADGVVAPITVPLIVPPVIVADAVLNDAAVVAPRVEPPAFNVPVVVLPVTFAEVEDNAPVFVVPRLDTPVTPSVPPTVALFVTEAELSVANPEVDKAVKSQYHFNTTNYRTSFCKCRI